MRYLIIIAGLLGTLSFSTHAQSVQVSPRIANYNMQVELDVDQKRLSGQTKLKWHNPSAGSVSELQFHLYYNAFKNSESTFFKESNGIPSFFKESLIDDCGWSWSNITSMTDENGHDLMANLTFIQPDDFNEEDQTVLQVLLKDSVLAGDSIIIDFSWEAKVPKSMVRTGYNMDYYFFAQWFPKVGVYEPAGTRFATEDQWNTHQYHANGEYYSDFGNYHVELTVPNNFVVGASGQLIDKTNKGNRNTWIFEVNDVIDFAWTASPHFKIHYEKWNDVEITLLTYPGHEHFADRYFSTVKNAFNYLNDYVGAYPYSTLTIVDPPIHGLFTGGMEYPTLITSISFCFFPKGFKSVETLTTHEFIHQYFMQMVATNEQEEPWMDEGLTTYYEGRILDHYLGEDKSFVDWAGIQIGNSAYNRYEFFHSENPKVANQTFKARDYKHGGYGPIAYNKTAIWLKTLENIIGREIFDNCMKTYFERWKFKHPNRDNFISVFNEVVKKESGEKFGENLNWFFDQVLFGSNICDYSVANIENTIIESPKGYIDDLENCIDSKENIESELINPEVGKYQSKVVFYRQGEIQMPQEISIELANGDVQMFQWDGMERSHDISIITTERIVGAMIDPKRKIWIDQNFLNNSLSISAQKKEVRNFWIRSLSSVQHILENLSFLI